MWVFCSACAEAREYAYSDAHLHYVDFFQETAGMPKLLKAMADNRIEHVMISGIPVAKKWHEDSPCSITPGACGRAAVKSPPAMTT